MHRHVEVVELDPSSADARLAMERYFAELDDRFAGGFDPGDALAEAARSFAPPNGAFVVARAGAATVGCGGLTHLDEHTAEIKRMWVSAASRGQGVGRRLLERLEALAVAAGRVRVVLDTNATLREAIAMYTNAGYTPVERYNDNPYAQRWFEKWLDTGAA